GRERPRLSALELDRARCLALRRAREDPRRAALFREDAPRRGAQWHLHHGRRRSDAPESRRSPARGGGAFSHAGLLSALRSHRVDRARRARGHPGDAPQSLQRATGPPHRSRRGRVDGEEEARGLFLNMTSEKQLIATDIAAYLDRYQGKELLR